MLYELKGVIHDGATTRLELHAVWFDFPSVSADHDSAVASADSVYEWKKTISMIDRILVQVYPLN